MIRTALFVSLALLVVPACKKKEDTSAGGGAAADKPAAGGPVKTTPKDLFGDFGPASTTKGMDLLNKYHDGATFSGTIKTAPGSEAPTTAIMDVDGKNIIMMDFTDAASVKAVKSGDTITATCKIGGENGAMMQATDCVLAK